MSNLRSKYLYTFPGSSTVFSRNLYNIRNSRRATSIPLDVETGQKVVNSASSNPNTASTSTQILTNNVNQQQQNTLKQTRQNSVTKENQDKKLRETAINQKNLQVQQKITEPTSQDQAPKTADTNQLISQPTASNFLTPPPLPLNNKLVVTQNPSGLPNLRVTTKQIVPAGIDLGKEFFLIIPESKEQDSVSVNLGTGINLNDTLPQLSSLDSTKNTIGSLTPNSVIDQFISINKPTFPSPDSLELLDPRKNFDFLELPQIDSRENLDFDERPLIISDNRNTFIKQKSSEQLDSKELPDRTNEIFDVPDEISDIDGDNFDLPDLNDNEDIFDIDDLFEPGPFQHPSLPLLSQTIGTSLMNNQLPTNLGNAGLDSEDFYKIVTNILKLDAPENNFENSITQLPGTGVPLPPINQPEITTKRPSQPPPLPTSLPNNESPNIFNDIEIISPPPVHNSDAEPLTESPKHSSDPDNHNYIDSDLLDPPFDQDFRMPDLNVTGLLENFDFKNFNNNNFTNLSQTWKMNNKTATIVLVRMIKLFIDYNLIKKNKSQWFSGLFTVKLKG